MQTAVQCVGERFFASRLVPELEGDANGVRILLPQRMPRRFLAGTSTVSYQVGSDTVCPRKRRWHSRTQSFRSIPFS